MLSERRGIDPQAAPAPSQTADELRDAVAARDELLSVIGHELRNAMAPLLLLTAQFEMMPVDDMMRAKVAMLTRNLKTFVGTLDRVSEVSSLREGKLVLEPAPVDAQDVVRDVARDLAKLAKAAGCELRLETESVVGHWDRARLAQITNHLVSNAIRYGGTPIDISVRAAGDQLELVVHDAGPGIAVADRARLFDRFDRSGGKRSGGLGVGLWVVRALCRAMGGTVCLGESVRGARFCVALPRG